MLLQEKNALAEGTMQDHRSSQVFGDHQSQPHTDGLVLEEKTGLGYGQHLGLVPSKVC